MKKKAGSRFDILSKGLRRKRGEMNKTEAKYADHLSLDPGVYQWWFEPFSLRISHPPVGQPAMVSPDFLVLMADGTTYVDDVKSGGLDDNAGIVRLKAAAELYQLWKFRLVVAQALKHGGGFRITEI